MLETYLGLSIRDVGQRKEVAEMFVEFVVREVGVILFQDLNGDVLTVNQIAVFRQPCAVVEGRFELLLGGTAKVQECFFLLVRTQAVEDPLQLFKAQLLGFILTVHEFGDFLHAAHQTQHFHNFGKGEREFGILFIGDEQLLQCFIKEF